MHTFTNNDLDLTSSPRVGSVLAVHVRAPDDAAAVINFRNGSDSGEIVIPLTVVQGTSAHLSFFRPALFPKGLYVEVVAEADAGTVIPG